MASEETIHLDRYAHDARVLVAAAQSLADERKHELVEPLHLLARALESNRGVAEVFKRAGASPSDVSAEAEAALTRLPKGGRGLSYLSSAMIALLGRAEKEAGVGEVTLAHVLNALAQEIRGPAGNVLQLFNLGPGSLRPHMDGLKLAAKDPVGATSDPAALAKYTRNLTDLARTGGLDPVIGRDVEVRRLVQILERRSKSHPLLVGDHGVGKSAVVHALASRIAQREVPANLAGLTIRELELGSLAAGAKLRGEVEERLRNIVAESSPKDTLLYVPQIDSIYGASTTLIAVADLLRSLISRGEIRVLASTTPEGMRKMNERDFALLRSLTVVDVAVPSVDAAIEILRGVASRYEAHHHVSVGEPAIVAAVRLAKRYLQDRRLPDSALDLLDEACARKRVEIDGIPDVLDTELRRVESLRSQIASLVGDDDALSTKTRTRLEQELALRAPAVATMRARLDSRRGAVAADAALKAELDQVLREVETARTKQDFAKLGELEHVQLPDIRRRYDAAHAALEAVPDGAPSPTVTEEDIARVLGDWTGIPIARMLESETEKLMSMEQRLGARVVGQKEAVLAVARAVRRGRVGLREAGKPIGSFLLLGPTGVGKTELAKALAEFLFDDEQSLTRLDMSEFMEKHMAQRLVGAPPGYVDSEEGGFLTEAVRRRPYSVLLFDEIEKAHADVFNLLLQVLDDGRLTDGRGRTADFSNTVILMTSNIGSKRILETDLKLFESEEGRDAIKDVLQTELREFMRPELLNRIDDIVVFHPLRKEDLHVIVDIQVKRLERMLIDREITITLTEAAKQVLVEAGYEPGFGARPLKRAILKLIQDPLSERLLTGKYASGTKLAIDARDGQLVFPE